MAAGVSVVAFSADSCGGGGGPLFIAGLLAAAALTDANLAQQESFPVIQERRAEVNPIPLTDPQADELPQAGWITSFDAPPQVLADPLPVAEMGSNIVSIIPGIQPPTWRGGLRNNLEKLGSPPASLTRPQAHHNLPWKFEEWFAGQGPGLNVNDPQFGRWVESSPQGSHQQWTRAYEDAWTEWIGNRIHMGSKHHSAVRAPSLWGAKRVEGAHYPDRVCRELVVNACVHRNYAYGHLAALCIFVPTRTANASSVSVV